MATNEPVEDSAKSPAPGEVDTTVSELKTEKGEEDSSVAPSVNENNGPNDAVEEKVEEKGPISEQDNATEERKDVNDTVDEKQHDLRSLVANKCKQEDEDKKEPEEKVKEETEKKDTESMVPPQPSQDATDTKDSNNEDNKNLVKVTTALKRKRKSQSSSVSPVDSPLEEGGTRSKRKKMKNTSDRFCWRCHKETVDVSCTACPRSWHRRCIGGAPPSPQKWICGECATILTAENAETRSTAMAQLSVDQLCMLLKHVVERLRDYPGSEPFCKPVDLEEVPNYMDYVIKPMDLSLLESNVKSKLYGSTDAFMADAKWIQHNCIVFNTCGGVYADTSKLTNTSKQLIKVARSEISEIEACPDCYAHGRNLPRPQPTWFIEPCRRPHPLVWAKLKGFPFWPAKVMPRVNSQGFVDVRFFGEHDRAWVAPKDLYLYSEEPPAPSSRKRKSDMDECVREITRHCRKLELMFGQFKFAPRKVQYNPNDPMQIKLMLPNYNPSIPNNHVYNSESFESKKKTPPRKRSPNVSKLQNESVSEELSASRNSVNGDNQEKKVESTPPKVQKLSSEDAKGTANSQSNLSNNHNKLSEKVNQEVASAPNKTAKNEPKKRAKASLVKNNANAKTKTPSPSRTVSDKSNTPKVKNEGKVEQQLSKPAPKSGDTTRAQKKNAAKSPAAVKREAVVQSSPKSAQKKESVIKTYKPKKQMVDKLNAEKALKAIASKENDQLTTPNSSGPAIKKPKDSPKKTPEVDTTSPSTAPVLKALPRIEPRPVIQSANLQAPVSFAHANDPKSVLLLVVNNGTTTEAAKQQSTSVVLDYPGNKDANPREAKDSPPTKKESKAKKTFPNKLRAQASHRASSASTTEFPAQVSTAQESNASFNASFTTSSDTYQLLPPEAGPISARLHHSAQELARRMGQLMEEAYKEAAEASDGNNENGTADNYQATIFFLRMQIEHMKWQHQQQMAELKHNADRTMREMRASLEAEKLRSVQEARREIEEEKIRCIEETKQKQWCAKCGQEALFYCCWNTAYCDYPCQQLHWPLHMRTCSQQPAFTTIVTSGSGSSTNTNNSQVMPRLVLNATSDVWKA